MKREMPVAAMMGGQTARTGSLRQHLLIWLKLIAAALVAACPESHVYHGVSRTKTQQTSGFRETHVWTEYCEASCTVMYNHLLDSKSSDMLNYIIFSPAGIIHCL